MPKPVEDRLERRIQKFLWGDKKKINVNKETVYAPIEEGGRNLLDILLRNEAITITWLKSYLDFGPNHPTWAAAVDAIVAHHMPASEENVDLTQRMIVFLQSWKASNTKLPDDIKRMFQTAMKYNVTLDGLALSREILREMPIWYHIKSKGMRGLFNRGVQVKCLKMRHEVRTVGDAEKLALLTGGNRHTHRQKCACDPCKEARDKGCEHPYKCFAKAKDLLNSLPEKWNPLLNKPEDEPERLHDEDEENTLFKRHLTMEGSLGNVFRIFADGNECTKTFTPDTTYPEEDEIVAYTDGSAINTGTNNATAGAGIYFGEEDDRNMSLRIPDEVGVTNQAAELVAAKTLAEMVRPYDPM
ncbi:hypothetical protein CPB85DRAFT_1241644, partial [Mucidula mucida]